MARWILTIELDRVDERYRVAALGYQLALDNQLDPALVGQDRAHTQGHSQVRLGALLRQEIADTVTDPKGIDDSPSPRTEDDSGTMNAVERR